MKSTLNSNRKRLPIRVAAFTDRFLAMIFDFVIFTPIFSFILSPIIQNAEKVWQTSGTNMELLVFVGVAIVYSAFLTILFQAASLFWFRTTPGKYFFKLRVVNEDGEALSLHQSFLRSIFWVLQFGFLAIPFLEVLSHPLRRAIHDRVSGTMVITLKEVEDVGPHPLERHFIRQVLMVVSIGLTSWIFVLSNYFLGLAERGDFKKVELEEAGYLCEEVSNNVSREAHRIEKAIALYLADEISKDCLLTEADFTFWQPVPVDRDWGYLAKAFANKIELDTFEKYLNRVCEENEEGTACFMAQYEADPKLEDIESFLKEKESIALNVKYTIDSFESGRYEKAEVGFKQLLESEGFESFALKGLIKSLWAQNKKELSKGVYLASFLQLKETEKIEISAWSCHEQIDDACNSDVKSACIDLKDQLAMGEDSSSGSKLDSFTALALIRENECRQSEQQDWRKFHSLFQRKKDLYQYVRAISKESDLSALEREGILEDIAFRKNPVSPQFLRRMAVVELAKNMKAPRVIEKVTGFLKDRKNQDLTWVKTFEQAVQRLVKIGDKADLAKIINLPQKETANLYLAKDFKLQALYAIKDFEQLKVFLAASKISAADRAPASLETNPLRSSNTSIEKILQELKQYEQRKQNFPQLKESKSSKESREKGIEAP